MFPSSAFFPSGISTECFVVASKKEKLAKDTCFIILFKGLPIFLFLAQILPLQLMPFSSLVTDWTYRDMGDPHFPVGLITARNGSDTVQQFLRPYLPITHFHFEIVSPSGQPLLVNQEV